MGYGGALRAISRQQAWRGEGEPAPGHPYLLSHARLRQIMRTIKTLPITQKQAGWSRLQLAYFSVSDDEVREAMRGIHPLAGRRAPGGPSRSPRPGRGAAALPGRVAASAAARQITPVPARSL